MNKDTNFNNETLKVNSGYTSNSVKSVKEKQPKKLLFVLIFIVVLACTVGGAYARYKAKFEGTLIATIADARCSMVVTTNAQEEPIKTGNKEIVNPYCLVKVRNYNNEGTSQTDLKFKITVEQAEGESFTMPEYYWLENGNIVAHSTDLVANIGPETNDQTRDLSSDSLPTDLVSSDTVSHIAPVEKTYKIVFVNPGDENITQRIHFNLVATQAE